MFKSFFLFLYVLFSVSVVLGQGRYSSDPFGGSIGDEARLPIVRENFRVSQTSVANRAKLLELFEECKKNYVVMESGGIVTRDVAENIVEEIKRRDSEAYRKKVAAVEAAEMEKGLVRGLIVFQRLNSREFLAKAWWSNDLIYIRTLVGVDSFNGDLMTPMYLARSGEYSYVAISGAARNVKAFEQTKVYSGKSEQIDPPVTEVPKFKELTKDSFTEALKSKQSFKVVMDGSVRCRRCSGVGTVSSHTSGTGLQMNRDVCRECDGAGKQSVRNEYIITW